MRSVTTREAEWDDESRAQVLALIEYEGLTCPGCGGYIPETTDDDNTFVAETPHRCYRCTATAVKRQEYQGNDANKHTEALVIWPVKMR